MKKTYKLTLPKDKEVAKQSVRIEDGNILVDVELKDKFEPKDGDFIYIESSVSYSVFIYKQYTPDNKNHMGCYAARQVGFGEVYWNFNEENYAPKNRACRFATPKEKADLLECLEKERHKRWNPETKKLEDIRWSPEIWKSYFFINDVFNVLSTNNVTYFDSLRIRLGNCFRTEEAAQKVADQIKEIFKNSKGE